MPEYFFHVGIDLARPSAQYRRAVAVAGKGPDPVLKLGRGPTPRVEHGGLPTWPTDSAATGSGNPGRSFSSDGTFVADRGGTWHSETSIRGGGHSDRLDYSTTGGGHTERSTSSKARGNSPPADSSPSSEAPATVNLDDDWRAGAITVQRVDMAPAAADGRPTTPKDTGTESKTRSGTDAQSTIPLDATSRLVSPSSRVDHDLNSTNTDGSFSSPLSHTTATAESHPSGARFGASLRTDANQFATKGRFEPVAGPEAALGWGIVRLFRDTEETPGLYDDVTGKKTKHTSLGTVANRDALTTDLGHSSTSMDSPRQTPSLEPSRKTSASGNADDCAPGPSFRDEDCTTLCILAVPLFMTPADFLGFVGEQTRKDVSHFRMIRTDRVNRYMVLLKFRSGRRAREWRREWNRRAFNNVETETCHVVFIKSIKFRTPPPAADEASFPDLSTDPFTPTPAPLTPKLVTTDPFSSLTAKPIAPPTPALKELPTCPVCLERMDESTGLLTILCQHVFHCACLAKWPGSGCPVCRYTQADAPQPAADTDTLNACAICHAEENLWICLVCGHVGCGRYDAAHAFLHYKQTAHSFALDLGSQRVWDYDSDGYVHRIMQNKTDGKLLHLPSASGDYDHSATDETVPRAKLEALSHDYTRLLTSQLDSQRLYFEAKLERAADKASEAASAAQAAADGATRAVTQLSALQAEVAQLRVDCAELTRDRNRAHARTDKFEVMARTLTKSWREEQAVARGLSEKVTFLEGRVAALGKEKESAEREKAELEEMNRDMQFYISGQAKVKELEGELGEEITEGTVGVVEGKKGKGKGRKR